VNPYENGLLDKVAFRNYVLTSVQNDSFWSSWSDFLEKTFDECHESASAKSEDFKISFALHPAFEGEKICHPISGAVVSCIQAGFFTKCPSSRWKPDAECNKIKGFANSCKLMPPINST